MKFSKLDKDEKTWDHINLYYEAFLNRTPLISVSNLIQKRELEEHLKRVHFENAQKECLDWMNVNCKNFRCYINSLIAVTEYLMMDVKLNYRAGPVKRIFFNIIDMWNEDIEKIEFIRLEDKL